MTQATSEVIIQFLQICDPPIQGHFLNHYFGQSGLKDGNWVKALFEEGGDWFVISGDRDRKRKGAPKLLVDGPPLIAILPKYGISAVYVSSALCQAKPADRASAVINKWKEIHDFFEREPAGSRRLLTHYNRAHHLKPF